jgi:nitrate reductase gamma subunit
MSILIGGILPFVTIIVFLSGIIYHIRLWSKLAAPKMTLTPAPEPGLPRFVALLKEMLFFKSLFRGDKNLWFLSWIFHAMLALIFIGHLRVVSWLPDRILAAVGMTPENIDKMSYVTGGGAGIVIIIMVSILLLRRIVTGRVREISSGSDFFALILVLCVLVTGDAMRFLTHFDLSQTREYFAGLFTFSALALPQNNWFMAHFLFAQLLIMYMPFSKLLHFGGIFYSEALVHKH